MAELTAEYLRSIVSYDPDTGEMRWAKARPGTSVGRRAGTSNGRYIQIRIDYRKQLAHRLVWLYVTGKWPPDQIDHINGDGLDNRWSNLRLATLEQNAANAKMRCHNTSGHRGVGWSKKRSKWQARIRINRKLRLIGFFESIEEAAFAYGMAACDAWGEYARFN